MNVVQLRTINDTLFYFVDISFASILFSCIASFLQHAIGVAVMSRSGNGQQNADNSGHNGQHAAPSPDYAVPNPREYGLLDQISRIFFAMSALLYFYLIFHNRIAFDFLSGNVGVQIASILLVLVAVVCSGWYLFTKVEFFAVGIMLSVSAICSVVICYYTSSEVAADYFWWRGVWHGATGVAILVLGYACVHKPQRVTDFIDRFAGKIWRPLTNDGVIWNPLLRVVMIVWILVQTWTSFLSPTSRHIPVYGKIATVQSEAKGYIYFVPVSDSLGDGDSFFCRVINGHYKFDHGIGPTSGEFKVEFAADGASGQRVSLVVKPVMIRETEPYRHDFELSNMRE